MNEVNTQLAPATMKVIKPSVNQSRREYKSGKPPQITCNPCGKLGHKARDCWWQNGSEEEARRKSHISALTAENGQGDTRKRKRDQESNQSKVHELRRQPEVEKGIAEVTATTHGIKTTVGRSSLGPSITAELKLERSPVHPLLDTSSPATIVSLEYLIWTLLKKPQHQPREEWEKDLKARVEPTIITVQKYGGGRLNVVGQIKVTLEKSPRMLLYWYRDMAQCRC